jgi:hypothetical protein
VWHVWGERRDAYRVVVPGTSGKETRVRSRRRWEDNIKMDLKEIGRGAWSGLFWLKIGTLGGLL